MKTIDIYNGQDPRDIPNYTYPEASRLSGVPQATLRSWVRGRPYPRQDGTAYFKPIIELPDADIPALSYNNIIEVHVLSFIRKHHQLELRKVRSAIDFMKKKWKMTHPLTYQGFKTDGIDLFIEQLGGTINASRGGQMVFQEAIEARLTRIEYGDDGHSIRLFPFVRNLDSPQQPKIISADPRVSFGKPVIAGTGIPVTNIVERLEAGDSIAELADDFQIQPAQVEEAIRYMLKKAA